MKESTKYFVILRINQIGPITDHFTEAKVVLFASMSFVTLNDTWSQYGHSVSCMTILLFMLANHQIRHRQATRKVSYQTGDSRRSQSSSGVHVGMYGLKYSL